MPRDVDFDRFLLRVITTTSYGLAAASFLLIMHFLGDPRIAQLNFAVLIASVPLLILCAICAETIRKGHLVRGIPAATIFFIVAVAVDVTCVAGVFYAV